MKDHFEKDQLVDPGLTITPHEALTPQTVEIRGVDDSFADGDVAYQVTTSAPLSLDTRYAGLDPADLDVTNLDDESSPVEVPALSSVGAALLGGLLLAAALIRLRPLRGRI